MSNDFKITISAVDKATKTIRSVNDSMSKLGRPVVDVGRSFKNFGKEIINNPIPATLLKIGKTAQGATGWLGKMLTPMTALTGLSSIAGITALAESWGRAGINITNAASRIGMSTGQLQSFRGVATAAGLSADSMQGALVGLGSILQGALYGRNNDALIMLNRLGVSIKRSKDGVVDTTQAMYDLSDAFAKEKNPHVQALMASPFGLEGMLPAMKNGSEALKAYNREMERLGVNNPKAVAANDELGKSWNRLKLSIEGVGNRLSESLSPKMSKYLDNLSERLSGHIGGKSRWDAANSAYRPGLDGRSLPAANPAILAANNLAQQSIGIRNNNPLNLRKWGDAPQVGGYAAFANPVDGITAAIKNLQTPRYSGLNTISSIIGKWAPSSENNTAAYIADVSKQTGLDPDAQIDKTDPKTLAPLLSAMIRHENGKNPYSPEQIQAGIAAGLGGAQQPIQATIQVQVNAPAGTTVTAHSDHPGINAMARVDYALDTSLTP